MAPAHTIITVSPTSAPWLSGDTSCMSRFHRLGVLKQYPEDREKSNVLKFGDLVHFCLRDLYDPRTPGPLPHTEGLEEYLRLALLRCGFEGADREFAREKARKLIQIYLKQQDAEDALATVAVELSGLHQIHTASGELLFQLSAKLDRVMVFDDGARVVAADYKTGIGKLPPIAGVLANLCALKAAIPGGKSYEFRIEALSSSGVEMTRYFGEDFKGQVKVLSGQVRRYLASTEYPATANEGCVFCPLRPTCTEAGSRISEDELEF